MMTLIYFLIAIAILVFVHEMGHFLAARQCGVQVERFSIGFGKELLKWVSRRSGTEWAISAIPLGGYVKMNEADFESKALRARAWIVLAGPLANLVFAAFAYAFLFHAGREEPQALLAQPKAQTVAATAGLREGDRVLAIEDRDVRSFNELRWRIAQSLVGEGAKEIRLRVARGDGQVLTPVLRLSDVGAAAFSGDPAAAVLAMGLVPMSESVRVIRVQEGSVAQAAGLRNGDRILKVGTEEVRQPESVIARVQESKGQPLELVVSDGTSRERVLVTPRAGQDGVFRIGAVVGGDVAMIHIEEDPVDALVKGITRTWEMSVLTFRALGRMVMGELSWRQISGPVTIAETAGQSAGNGLQAFIGFLAMISISIAVLNLLPIPMLDGGHLMYYLWEFVRGRPLPAEVQEAGRRVGVALIMALTAVALFNDFARIAGW
ncbi:MAG: RIP metalloprotease RseP [Burkholderiaceae bacterium]|nr:RIP metalloprotease RseP [Burkholderiaceae bacterium]